MKKNIYSLIAVSGLMMLASGCSFLDLKPNIIASETFYNSKNEVLYGLAGVYGVMNNEEFYGNYYSLMCSNVDDLSYFNRSTTNQYVVWYKHDASAPEVYSAWVEIYQGIRNANAFMEAMENSEFDTDHKYYNEARFLRAYYHFILAQAWGDVPLKDSSTKTPDEVNCPATPQYDVLKWCTEEMEACLPLADESLDNAPSRVTKTTIQGILARVYLFMAGESVSGGDKKALYKSAMDNAYAVIQSGRHQLNPDYSNIFINMISDVYDTQYHESMWEVDFMGNRSSAENWSNGRIGDLLGLQSTGSTNFSEFACNYSYAQYDGSLHLWDLYWTLDRTDAETSTSTITDKRQEWNMCPYNYAGNANYPPYPASTGRGTGSCSASFDKTPYVYDNVSTGQDPTAAQGIRNCGKFRREVEYEGVQDAKRLYTQINYPLLRYADVLLMYAEAYNEYNGSVTEEVFNYVKAVRDRAGIATRPFSDYDSDSFRQFVRNERGRELCFESLRKYDLIRWGIFVDVMNKQYAQDAADERWSKNAKATYALNIGSSVQPKHVVLPIPSVELGVNKELQQNPLW